MRILDLPPLRDPARRYRRVGNRLSTALGALTLAALLLAGTACASRAQEQPNSGYAYVGPSALNLRKDLGPRAPTIATVKHGDRLEVIETRRRFVKVRVSPTVEGWTDSNLLLTQQQMDDLNVLATSASTLPSQGKGTVFDALNMHTQPNRQSPSFYQIAEGAPLDVVSHVVSAHGAAPVPPKAVVVRRVQSKKKAKELKSTSALGPPPVPAPPPNWEALSRPRKSDLTASTPSPAPSRSQSAAALGGQNPGGDDWYLVRTKDGRAGWVLARMVSMSIPDEVAQYAEGHRVSAYLSLGDVTDPTKSDLKHNWVWTTSASNLASYDFDSFRVFVWSPKRHHYETAFIERNVRGFYPVEPVEHPADLAPAKPAVAETSSKRKRAPREDSPQVEENERGFSVIVEEKDGMRYKRTYAFSGYHVRLVSKVPAEERKPLPEVRTAHNFDEAPAPSTAEVTTWSDRWKGWKERWFRR